jgi:hypothetical protein
MSEVAYFVKDIIGPKGAVSIVMAEQGKRPAREPRRWPPPTLTAIPKRAWSGCTIPFWADAVNSLKIVLAADKSVRTGEVVRP